MVTHDVNFESCSVSIHIQNTLPDYVNQCYLKPLCYVSMCGTLNIFLILHVKSKNMSVRFICILILIACQSEEVASFSINSQVH